MWITIKVHIFSMDSNQFYVKQMGLMPLPLTFFTLLWVYSAESCQLGDTSGLVKNGPMCFQTSYTSSYDCYDPTAAFTCCRSCNISRTSILGCQYGDIVTSCFVVLCPLNTNLSSCCYSCRTTITTTKPTTKITTTMTPPWPVENTTAGSTSQTSSCPSTVCPTITINVTNSSSPVIIPITRINFTGYSWNRCYPGSRAFASAPCLCDYDTGARWGNITLATDCQQAPSLEYSSQSKALGRLLETTVDVNVNNSKAIIDKAANLTSAPELRNADVLYTAQILEKLQQISSLPSDVLDGVITVANNMLKLDPAIIHSAQDISSSSNRILRAVDDMSNKVSLPHQGYKRIIQPYLAAEIWEQTDPNITGLEFIQVNRTPIGNGSLNTLNTAPDNLNRVDAAIYIDPKVLQGSTSRLAMHVYYENTMFDDDTGRYETISRVVAARLSKNGRPIADLGNSIVTSIFRPFKEHTDVVCGHWNYTGNQNAGGWSTEGCTHSVDDGRHICKCNHLTNFALLMDLQPDRSISEADKLALGIITKIGLGVSIGGLGLTILSFLMFRNLRKSNGQKTLAYFCMAMMGSAILFLVGIDRTETYIGCIIISALLHYFILASFMWMLIEGFLQYLRFVKVLGTYIPQFMIKTLIPAWGTPLVPVIVILSVDYKFYYGGRGYCWMQLYPLYWAFILPIGLIIAVNFIIFIIVIVKLCRRPKGMRANQSDRKRALMNFQAGLAVFVLLGLTWVFGFMAVEEARVAFMYVFAFLNAFQGFFVFLLFTAREKRVRQSWVKLCCKKEGNKNSTSYSDSRSQKYSVPLSQSSNLYNQRSGHAQRSSSDYIFQ